MTNSSNEREKTLLETIRRLTNMVIILVCALAGLLLLVVLGPRIDKWLNAPEPEKAVEAVAVVAPAKPKVNYWQPPAETEIKDPAELELIQYGKDLVVNTALYFGPQGTVKKGATNGMNCQNCHLNGGTKPFGNNYGSVAANYPRYRARSGTEEDIVKRVSDCFERSLNGTAPAKDSREMQAMTAYINWLGKDVPKGQKAEGSGLKPPSFLAHAALPEQGAKIYAEKCSSCHGPDGAGVMNPAGTAYIYPPMWGPNSYNDGAGLYRMSNFAAYVKYNMPLGATFENPQLTDEEAWDVAAFVNSQKRPGMDKSKDWPKIEEKPFDHPFGPFADNFTPEQHKYGPFQPIKDHIEQSKKDKK